MVFSGASPIADTMMRQVRPCHDDNVKIPYVYRGGIWRVNIPLNISYKSHLSALLQLHFNSRPGFNGLGKDNCKMRSILALGFGASYTRYLTVHTKVIASILLQNILILVNMAYLQLGMYLHLSENNRIFVVSVLIHPAISTFVFHSLDYISNIQIVTAPPKYIVVYL